MTTDNAGKKQPGTAQKAPLTVAEKRAQLKRLLMNKEKQKPVPHPLSFSQQSLWVMDQLEGPSPTYNMKFGLWLDGHLDLEILEKSFHQVIARHGSLRTSFGILNGEPTQWVAPPKNKPLNILDLSHSDPETAKAQAEALLLEASAMPFNLTKGPMFRLALVRVTEERHLLILVMHHIISDGWSMSVFVNETISCYKALLDGKKSDLPALPMQYADYARKQQADLKKGAYNKAITYWKKQLANAPALLDLPTDNPRPPKQSFKGGMISFPVDNTSLEQMRDMTRRSSATLFMGLGAAFSTLLSRYSGQTDLVIGTPLANRRTEEERPLIGFFINLLALRIDLSEEPSFQDMIKRLRDVARNGFANQGLPFEQVVKELKIPRRQDHQTLVQVSFVYHNFEVEELSLPGVEVEQIGVSVGTTKFDLNFRFFEDASGMRVDVEYNSDIFTEASIQRMSRHFGNLLNGFAAHPELPVSQLPMMDDAEQQHLLTQWNGPALELPAPPTLYALLQARLNTPDTSTAVIFEDQSLSYAKLAEKVLPLAHHLRAQGANSDNPIAMIFPRGLDMIVATYAILASGAAYLPIDVALPEERISYMLDDSGAQLLLTTKALAEDYKDRGQNVIALDDLDLAPQTSLPECHVVAEHPAYVIYTSGSTGRPKGVMIPNEAIINYLYAIDKAMKLDKGASFALVSSMAVDLGITMTLSALVANGPLHVLSEDRVTNPEAFASYFSDRQVDCIKLVPSHMQALLTAKDPSACLPRQLLILGGEASGSNWIEEIRALRPDLRLLNHYGPTEATVGMLTFPVEAGAEGGFALWGNNLPLGFPIHNKRGYVVDAHLNLQPSLIPGELLIGGRGLARGYLNQPALTAASFVPNPFANEGESESAHGAGSRLYRTGDLVRRQSDGRLTFLGRIDFQVKIRGYRIELGEIENALRNQDDLRDALVTVSQKTGEPQLVAYLLPAEGADLSTLNERLGALLPAYMVPSIYMPLAEWPLLPNGKINRKALPTPDQQASIEEKVAPSSTEEELLHGIWCDVLGLSAAQVGTTDDFFELGGHSLSAMRLIAQVRKTFSIELALRDVFAKPTIAEQAGMLPAMRNQGSPLKAPKPAKRGETIPLSFAQQRLWFLDKLETNSSTYNIPVALHLEGAINEAAIRHSFDQIVTRHESLRTLFVEVDGAPVQVISPEGQFKLPVVDLSDLEDKETKANQITDDEAAAPFDLQKGPLFRAKLLRLASDSHILLLTMHHIVSDGWSMGLMLDEFKRLYQINCGHDSQSLPALPLQYPDYAIWQREWLQDDTLNSQLQYWKKELDGAPSSLDLPTIGARPANLTYRGEHADFWLDAELTQGLNDLARTTQGTLFLVLEAAWAELLGRYGGGPEVNIGIPVANRAFTELESLIGFFVNTLVLRNRRAADASVRDRIAAIRETALGAFAHQDLPFEKLVEEINPVRDPSRSPIFQIMFVLQNTVMGDFELEGVNVSPYRQDHTVSKFDMVISLAETEDGMKGGLDYNPDLFAPGMIQRLLGHYVHMLKGFVADPDRKLDQIALLPDAERNQLLHQFNDTKKPYGHDLCMHQLFEARTARTPEATALIFGEQSITYEQLNRRANRLANHLRKNGVASHDLVVLGFERSMEMVIALMGILKAGAAYVPVDPSWPKERVEHIIAETKTPLMLSHTPLAERLGDVGVPTLRLDEETFVAESHENLDVAVSSDQLAYIIFTSGSTGKPKGVILQHRPVINLIEWVNQTYQIGPNDRLLFTTSLCFDLSVYDVFGILAAGGSVRVASQTELEEPQTLVDILCEDGITFWDSAPAALQRLAPLFPEDGGTDLRLVFLSGDWIPLSLPPALWDTFSNVSVISLGGATEATIWSNFWPITEIREGWVSVPYGNPIQNARYYVLDSNLEPCAPGVQGDLYIGGQCLSLGYFNQASLTADRYKPDPHSTDPGGVLYTTGDQARWMIDEDGTQWLEFLGRLDHQVKVRGFRIELGEIETVLRQHDAVKEAVVLAIGERTDKRLVAFPIASESDVSVEALREELAQHLPEYMVPSEFVYLDNLPATANGKVDRKALMQLAEDLKAPDMEAAYVAPRNGQEEILAEIFQSILKLPRVGVHDDFFELGGHSLLVARLAAQIGSHFGVRLSVRELFEHPNIAAIAVLLENHEGGDQTSQQTIPVVSRDTPPPLSFSQRRLWFLDRLEGPNSTYNIPSVLRVKGTLDIPALEHALTTLVERHESLRTTFYSLDEQPVTRINEAQPVQLKVTEISGETVQEQEANLKQLIKEEAALPFDLEAGPLYRFDLWKMGENDHVFSITMNHIVTDGWSLGLIVREVIDLYQDRNAKLKDLSIQFADYATWQQEWLSGERLEQRLDWWGKYLDEAPELLEIPTDRPRPAQQTYNGDRLYMDIDQQLTDRLRELGNENNATLYMTLLAGFGTLLSRYSNQKDILIGSPIANRAQPELEDLVGFFVNTLVIRIQLDGNPTFKTLIDRVKQGSLDAFNHGDVPFDQVVEARGAAREMSHSALFQAMMTLQNLPEEKLEIAGLEITPIIPERDVTMFDLTMPITEVDGILKVELSFNTDLFDRKTMVRFLNHFQTILESAVAEPDQYALKLPMLGEEETRELLVSFNDTSHDVPVQHTYAHLFEAQVARTPERIAVSMDDRAYSYGDLNARANGLCLELKKLGLLPETTAALFMPRSEDFLTSVLATFKAGAAYLPMDIKHPEGRLAQVITLGKPKLVITAKSLEATMAKALEMTEHEATLVVFEDVLEQATPTTENPPALGSPEHLAYTIFTSGSTGLPKGAMVIGHGMINHLYSKLIDLDLQIDDVVAQNAPQCFDISVWQFLLALLVGARTHVYDDDTARDVRLLSAYTGSGEVTILELVPSMLRVILEELDETGTASDDFQKLRWLLLTGEALPPDLADRWIAYYPEIPIVNAYGPTECSDDVTHYVIDKKLPETTINTPIGSAIVNTDLYITDNFLQPLPLGVNGELLVGGYGVGRGYLADPGRTAAVFIPNPFAKTPGERLYKTGDLVRYHEDGLIEFLGRIDHQVKIRGHRIELGEIESVLNDLDEVRECAVIARDDERMGKAIVAYVVPGFTGIEDDQENTNEKITHWQNIFDQAYGDDRNAEQDDSRGHGVLINSYTREAFSEVEYGENIDSTVERILDLKPKRVLEIGCGIGSLLFKVAPHCEEYWGTDISEVGLSVLGQKLEAAELDYAMPKLHHLAAHDFKGLPEGHFDLIVINEVVQCFPHVAYLVKVLERAVKMVAPGGHIFLGNLRNFNQFNNFHTSVQLEQSSDKVSIEALRQAINASKDRENELLIAPALFAAIQTHLPVVTGTCVQLKGGQHQNELTKYRYDAVLQVNGETPAEAIEKDYKKDLESIEALKALLESDRSARFMIRNVPNRRLAAEAATLKLLEEKNIEVMISDFRAEVASEIDAQQGIDPNQLWDLATELGMEAAINWADQDRESCVDVLFAPASQKVFSKAPVYSESGPIGWYRFANNPDAEEVMPRLREICGQHLPEYMVPAYFIAMDSLPLTPNGKLDRKSLPDPDASAGDKQIVTPRSPMEQAIANIWMDVLKLSEVGVYDDFFELGGHSLVATRVTTRMRRIFNIDMPLRDFFAAPTIAAQAEEVDRLRSNETALSVPLVPVPREELMPLSFSQRRVWFLSRLEPNSTAYNITRPLRAKGPLNRDVLERALNIIVSRHEVLRMGIPTINGEGYVRIMPELDFKVGFADYRHIPAEERERKAQIFVNAELALPFDLDNGPLFRVNLVRLEDDHHIAIVNLHHTISDGWSRGVLVREVIETYTALLDEREPVLRELPVQYTDYAVWQDKRTEELMGKLDYWVKQLEGVPNIDLPSDRPRPKVFGFKGATLRHTIGPETIVPLYKLSVDLGVTPFMLLLAAFKAFLWRFTGREDIAVGSPIANRTHSDLENLIGFFVNTLVFRTDLHGVSNFVQLLERVRGVTLDAYDNQEVPFDMVVKELNPDRDLSRNPLFNLMFIYHNVPYDKLTLPGLEFTYESPEIRSAKFDLTYNCVQTGDTLEMFIEYNTEIFDKSTVQSHVDHFGRILEEILVDAERPLEELVVLSPEERQHIVYSFNETEAELAGPAHIPAGLERSALQHPENPAVIFGEQILTNFEFNQQVNRLAHKLIAHGVGAESLVGVCLHRSTEMVLALHAVLKAGGAYVPLDPTLPEERLTFMIEDAKASVVITSAGLEENLGDHGATLVHVDAELSQYQDQPATNPGREIQPDQLAYMIFTSGSTGIPKGVGNTHFAIRNRLLWGQKNFQISIQDRILQKTPYSFDVSVWEFFWSAMVGATLVVSPPGAHKDALALANLVEKHQITVLHFVPSMLRIFMEQPDAADLSSLRKVLCSGEALARDLVESFIEHFPDKEIHNLYGPTEAAVEVTHQACTTSMPGASISIGKPVDNLRIYIVDAGLHPVPLGVPGQLVIAGTGLARGYHRRPGLTSKTFIADPFSKVAGERMYLSGDLAHFLPDGSIEFDGRIDHQVKLRGLRIELGEIEAILSQVPHVTASAAVVREDKPGDQRLVAYIEVAENETVTEETLKETLGERVPDYMIPSAFVFMDKFPLSPSGKLNRGALPIPVITKSTDYVAPETTLEKQIVSVWEELLGKEDIGITDNFFELGGHSLIATRVIARLKKKYDVELPVAAMFQLPTPQRLAARFEGSAGQGEGRPKLVAAERDYDANGTVMLPMSFSQRRLWLLDQLEGGGTAYHMALAYQIKGVVDGAAMEKAFAALVQRHETLRTNFALHNEQEVQIIHQEGPKSFQWIDKRGEDADIREIAEATIEAMYRPFDLTALPLLRGSLISTGDDEHIIMIVMHHIISDGWSMGVFIRDLMALYNAEQQGQEAPLNALPIQYGDYAAWQHEWLSGDELKRQTKWWREHLDGAPTLINLPLDRVRPPRQTYNGTSINFQVPARVADKLKQLSNDKSASLFMTLLASFNVLLARYCNQRDILVGSPVAGRSSQDLEDLIGFFVNTLVLRTDLSADESGSLSFETLLERVRSKTLDTLAHQDLPFEKLVEEMAPERANDHAPLFQVMFTLANAPKPQQQHDLILEPLEREGTTAKFDLSLALAEREEGFGGIFEYNTDLFDKTTIQGMISHFQYLLEGITDNPSADVFSLPLVKIKEQEVLLLQLNGQEVYEPQGSSLPQMIEAVAQSQPQATAINWDSQDITYAQLESGAAQIAQQIQEINGATQPIAISMTRCPEMIMAMIAVLKTGAAYVPVDPAYPEARRQAILSQSGAAIVLTQAERADSFGDDITAVSVKVDLNETASFSALPVDSAQLSHVLFTSGSTGTPKGVAITRANAEHMVQWAHSYFPEKGWDGVLASTSINFDLSVFEIFATLTRGGRIVLVENVLSLLDKTPQGAIRLINTVPSAAAELLGSQAIPETVEIFNLAGEALPAQTARALQALPHIEAVHNLYGPSEDTTYSTAAQVYAEDAVPPIGKPLTGTDVYLLDSNFNLIPKGLPGEVYLTGHGLAQGYYQNGALTAERFLPNPFGIEAGSRLYRTGDLARMRWDGQLVYQGRIDGQVKLRGFRIELGEIEKHLYAHEAVTSAALLVRKDRGEERLCAFVTTDGELSAEALETFLAARLPAYMVPAAFTFMDALPLNPNGKIDRKRLAQMPVSDSREKVGFQEPQTDTEFILANIWGDLLNILDIDRTDNFFNLGGHSLMAGRVMSRVRERFDVALQMRSLFDHPTLMALAAHIDAAADSKNLPPVTATARTEDPSFLPLSFAQKRLWFIESMEEASSAYNMPSALEVNGPLDIERLTQTLEAMIARHEILRTRFEVVDGEPMQRIAATGTPTIKVIDLAGLAEEKRQEISQQHLIEDAKKPFDLEEGPLLRILVIRHSENHFMLQVNMHHIISDGWSMGIFIQEMTAIYEALAAGQAEANLPELAVQYGDFAAWQHEHLKGAILDKQLSWWRDYLQDAPERLELPTDHPRPAMQSYAGASVAVHLNHELTEKLKQRAQENNASLFMALHSVYAMLLSRYSGSNDISIGTPVAGRSQTEVESLIGFFINTLVLRTQVDHEQTFAQLLSDNARNVLGAFEHSDLPFERLVEALSVKRSMSHSPLFQAMLVLQNMPAKELDVAGLQFRSADSATAAAQFDITLSFQETPNGLVGDLNYSSDLFEAATMERFARHLETLIEKLTEAPDQAVKTISMLHKDERLCLVDTWNQTAEDVDTTQPFHRLVERTAALYPDRLAIEDHEGNRSLTYAELNGQANALAALIQHEGVRNGDPVAIFMGRNAHALVAQLATNKVGAYSIHVDITSPEDRITYMLNDAKPAMILLDNEEAKTLIDLDVPTLTVTECSLDQDPGNLGQDVAPEQLVYAIYTSGTTGKPKAVGIRHFNLVNNIEVTHKDLFDPLLEELGDQPLRLNLGYSLCFDASVQQWGQLAKGHSLYIPPEEVSADVPSLAEYVHNHKIQVFEAPVAVLRLVLTPLLETGTIPPRILTGGEAVDAHLWERLANISETKAYNLYGPTEATIQCTGAEITDQHREHIGRPLGNYQAYVCDAHLQLQASGVVGELLIGGDGLAVGYLNQPALTAQAFVPDPYASKPGQRLYRTGDLARFSPEGNLRFMGRRDYQVKLRGYRIELGEIETVLASHANVDQALVMLREDTPGDPRLVAYIISLKTWTPVELRQHVQDKLPRYMVPSNFMVLETIPKNTSGKIDYAQLPVPQDAERQSYVAPRTPVEEAVAQIYSTVLGVEQVGREDHFFDLGGHSMLATKVMAELDIVFGIKLPTRLLFQSGNVAELAKAVSEALESHRAINTVSRDGAMALSPFQAHRAGDEPKMLVQATLIEGKLHVDAFKRACDSLKGRHETLRTRYAEGDGQFQAHLLEANDQSLLEVQELGAADPVERVRDVSKQLLETPLARDGETRMIAKLLCFDNNRAAFIWAADDLSADAWSMNLFGREVFRVYRSLIGFEASTLPELETHYLDVAAWQQTQAKGELPRQLAFWRKMLKGAAAPVSLPADYSKSTRTGNGAPRIQLKLDSGLERNLRSHAVISGSTPANLILAAYGVLLGRYTDQSNPILGMVTSNRGRTETVGLLGVFENLLPLNVDLGSPGQGNSFNQIIEALKQTRRQALESEGIPFATIADALGKHWKHGHELPMRFDAEFLPQVESGMPDLALQAVENSAIIEDQPFTLRVQDRGESLSVHIDFDANTYAEASIARFGEQLQNLLATLLQQPDASVYEASLVADNERRRILLNFNDTHAGYPSRKCVHQLFETRARKQDDDIAIDTSRLLSYEELNSRANRLARQLRVNGARPETRVALSTADSVEQLLGIAAILKAGAAIVMGDTPADLYLASEEAAKELPADVALISLGLAWETLTDEDEENPDYEDISPASSAFYTAEGMRLSHANIIPWIYWARSFFESEWLEGIAITDSVSPIMALLPISIGGTIVSTQSRDLKMLMGSAAEIQQAIQDKALPSGLEALCLTDGALSRDDMRQLKSSHDDLVISSIFATEASPLSIIAASELERAKTSTIGTPVSNTRTYILDAALEPVALGAIGTLYVSGDSQGHGWTRDVKKTADRFIPHPFVDEDDDEGPQPGARLLNTQLKARYNANGTISLVAMESCS